MNTSECRADLPYPSNDCVVQSECDCKLIMANFGGIISEMSAISQYFYHKLMADKEGYEEIGRKLLCISMVEMTHLNIFGGVITRLGGDPKFFAKNKPYCCEYWNGTMIDYGKEIKKMLIKDMELEEATIVAYRKQARVVQPCVATIIDRVIQDELLHLKILEDMLKSLR